MKSSNTPDEHCLSIVFGLQEDMSNEKHPSFIPVNSSEKEQIQQFISQKREYSCIDFIQQFPNIYSRIRRVAMPIILRSMIIDSLHSTRINACDFIEEDKNSGDFSFEYSECEDMEDDEIKALMYKESIDEYEDWVNWEVERLECADEEKELPSLVQRYLSYFELDNIEEDFYFEIIAIE